MRDEAKEIIANNEQSCIFIEEKDFLRISSDSKNSSKFKQMPIENVPVSYECLIPFYELYDYIYSDSYFFFSRNTSKNNPHVVVPPRSSSSFKEIGHFRTNNKTGIYSIYHHAKTTPDLLKKTKETDIPEINDIVERGILKAYEPQYDTYVFQVDQELVWLIGCDIPLGTEIVYNLSTDSPELLPPKRIQYGFDNKCFVVRSPNDIKWVGRFIIFRKDIPVEYPINHIKVGFNREKKDIWVRRFKLSNSKY